MDGLALPVVARFAAPSASQRTTIAILSDLHLSVDGQGSWRVSHRTETRLAETVDRLNAVDIDAVLFAGDLVNDAKRAEFDAFDAIIADLTHPFYAIPGNHDLYDREGGLSLQEFEDRYTPERLPFHARIGGIDLLGVSSNPSTHEQVATTWDGYVTAEELEWLADKVSTVDTPVVAIHHSLPGTRELWETSLPWLPVDGGSPEFTNGRAFLNVLRDAGAPLVVTGHLHFPAVVNVDGVREFTLPSLGPYPSGITYLECGPEGTVIRFESVASYEDRVEAFVHGIDHNRVQISAAQLAGFPLVDEFRDGQ